jgi:4-diphosphocytidyl-2-C-methyl-D-erythritol kinase
VTQTPAEGAFGNSRWPAPAKINLFLHITGRRADGYHLLQTLFQFLEWGDELDIRRRDDGRIVRHGGVEGLAPEADLVVRAAQALQRASGCADGADIHVYKRIPTGAGLGGGSSDAATTLVALNQIWNTGLNTAALAAIGLELGADVPVFVHGHAAWAEGVGEVLSPVEPPEQWYLLVLPDCHLATAALFADPSLKRDCPPVTLADHAAGRTGNVFEAVARGRAPALDAAMRWLSGFGAPALSGSGGACFLAFADRAAARAAQAQAPPALRTIVVRGCNRSPLETHTRLYARG